MTLVTPQMIRATRVALREAATTRAAAAAAASSSGSNHHLSFAGRASLTPSRASSPFAPSHASPFSTSVSRWSEADAQKAKAQEEQAAGEAMGTGEHKPEGEKSAADGAKEEFERQLAEKDAAIKELKVRRGGVAPSRGGNDLE